VVTGAVVSTVAVTGWLPLPVICTEEFDKLQVGAGVTDGVMAQLRLTVPVNPPDGVTSKLNFALCPALMVCEVGDPEAGPIVKSGAACTTSVTVVLCTRDPDVPETFTG